MIASLALVLAILAGIILVILLRGIPASQPLNAHPNS